MVKAKIKLMMRANGVTLVEIMVALSIFLLLFGGIVAALNISTQYWSSNKVRVELQQDLRVAMTRMSSELRQTSSSTNPLVIIDVPADGMPYSQITFMIPTDVTDSTVVWSAAILYSLSGTQLQRSGTVIANNIQTLQFSRTDAAPDIIQISLTAQKDTMQGRTITNNLNFSVQLRN